MEYSKRKYINAYVLKRLHFSRISEQNWNQMYGFVGLLYEKFSNSKCMSHTLKVYKNVWDFQ